MVLEERLAKINDKFKMEISVIKEYLEFMEMSVILTGLKSKKHSQLYAGMDAFVNKKVYHPANQIVYHL
jgi:hypothetical protein